MFKLSKTAACLAAALFAVGAGSAQAAHIDPFGLGGAGGVYDVANLGWNNGNAISTPIKTSNGTVNDTLVGDTVQTYGHGKLQGLNDSDGNSFVIAGFNPNNWTYVFGFAEIVTETTPGGRVFQTTTTDAAGLPLGTPNFFQIWANGKAASDLSGKGFNGDGGATLLLSGSVAVYDPTTGIGQTSFDSSSVTAGKLDQFGVDNYAGYESTKGTGGGKLNVKISSVNSSYFLDGLDLLTFDFISDTFFNLPYLQVNPSSCFWDGTAYFSGAGNGIADGCGVAGDFGTIGPVNGVYTGFPDVMFQTRATSVLPTGLPEPGTLALMGLGALGMFLRRRKP